MRSAIVAIVVALGAVGVRAAARRTPRRRPPPRRPHRPRRTRRRRRRGAGAPTSRCRPISCRISRSRRSRQATWSATVRTTGTVDWDNDHTTQAITQVSGPIARIVADTGTRVKAGDPLLYVASARHHQRDRRPIARPRTGSTSRSAARSQQGSVRAQGAVAARLRVGAGRLQRRGDRSADLAAGAEDLRRARRRTSPTPSSRTCRSGRSW